MELAALLLLISVVVAVLLTVWIVLGGEPK